MMKQDLTTKAPSRDTIEVQGAASVSRLTGDVFPAGAEVEVKISSEEFCDSWTWYEAKVLNRYSTTRKVKYKVQYLNLFGGDGSQKLLVEDVVYAKNVRPPAPRRLSTHDAGNEDEDPNFKMFDLVEAYVYDDGWWPGVVSGLRNPTTGLYTVSFPDSREFSEFKPSEIRPQLDYVNGKWVPVLGKAQKRKTFKEGDKVEVYASDDYYGPSYFPARVEKVIHNSFYLVKYASVANGNPTEILYPQFMRPAVDSKPGTNPFMVDSHVEVFFEGGWSHGVVLSGPSGSNYAVTIGSKDEPMTVHFDVSNMRLWLDWDGRRWRKWGSPSKVKKRKSVDLNKSFTSDITLTEESETTSGSVTSTGKKLKKDRQEEVQTNGEKAAARVGTTSHQQKLFDLNKSFTSDVTLTEESETTSGSVASTGKKLKKDRQEEVQINGEKAAARVGTTSHQQQQSSNTNYAADRAGENAFGVSSHDRAVSHIVGSESQCLLNTRDSFTDGVAKISKDQLVDSQPLNSSATMEHPTGSQDEISNPSLIRPVSSGDQAAPLSLLENSVSTETNPNSKFERHALPSLSRPVSSSDQAAPLSLIENSVSTETNPNSKFKEHTLAKHTPVKSVISDIVLPFEKISPLWKTLETTLKVFSCIPQTPHFMKLESECKHKREGLAIAMMVTYDNLSESIQRLSFHTEAAVLEEKISWLGYLEENGFIVDPIRNRLQRLLEIKKKYTESALKQVELGTVLVKKEMENTSLHASANAYEAKLENVRKCIAKLKEEEKTLMEEKAGVLGSTVEREQDISRLREEISSINRSNELAPEEFERVISEPLVTGSI